MMVVLLMKMRQEVVEGIGYRWSIQPADESYRTANVLLQCRRTVLHQLRVVLVRKQVSRRRQHKRCRWTARRLQHLRMQLPELVESPGHLAMRISLCAVLNDVARVRTLP
jgi:hypothetical protein